MTKSEIRKMIIQVLTRMGIDGIDFNQEINLQDFIYDSIFFITFIVEIEGAFMIEIPDEFLQMDTISSLDGFTEIVYQILTKSDKEEKAINSNSGEDIQKRRSEIMSEIDSLNLKLGLLPEKSDEYNKIYVKIRDLEIDIKEIDMETN